MRIILISILFCLIYTTVNSELIKPKPNIKPKEVISIQLTALKNNDIPFENAGIAQTWEFAHPSNRAYTGPLENFTLMMYSPSYIIMLNHQFHNIILVSEDENIAYYFIELIDKYENSFGFQWTLKKVKNEGEFKHCWMTVGVSRPMPLAKNT